MYLCRLPVLSSHSDQFPPSVDAVAAKHFAFTLIRGRIGGVKQPVDRRVQIYNDDTLLAFAISLFPRLQRHRCSALPTEVLSNPGAGHFVSL